MEKRIGFVGIILNNRKMSAEKVNQVLSMYGEAIIARTGLPRVRGNTAVITLVVDMSTDEMGALTGKLGAIGGITVKSAVAKV